MMLAVSGFQAFNYASNEKCNSNKSSNGEEKWCSYHKINSHNTKDCKVKNDSNKNHYNKDKNSDKTDNKEKSNNDPNFCKFCDSEKSASQHVQFEIKFSCSLAFLFMHDLWKICYVEMCPQGKIFQNTSGTDKKN